MKTIIYTFFALIAFAANSVLCRLALGNDTIDASSFTVVRLLSGVAMFLVILSLSSTKRQAVTKGSWISALMLFLYAIAFSYAYISLDTGIGALVLFGSVQITIILVSILSGNKLHPSEGLGMLVASGGFVYLIYPSITTPSISGFVLMAIAGIAWGIYTLKGRGSANPLSDTAFNFIRTTPFVIVIAAIAYPTIELSFQGVVLAVLSGALASGLGYTIWYIALGGLSATEAAVVQLLVPIMAAMGGVIFVSEVVTTRLILSAMLVLGGILIVVIGRYFAERKLRC